MNVLLVGADSPLGLALQAVFARSGRHEVQPLTLAASRWKSERQAKKAVRRVRSAMIVDLRIPHLLATNEELQVPDAERAHWIAKACQRAGNPYFYLSSSQVFSGRLTHPYREQEAPDAEDERGRLLAQAEEYVRGTCERHAILRTGPVFSYADNNIFTRILASLTAPESLALDDLDHVYPIEAGDLARVIAGMLDQLDAGADGWATYHYSSTDRTTAFGFAEAVLAAASQFIDMSGALIERVDAPEGAAARNWSLDCHAIRDTYAIKQVPWRGVISDSVRQYFLRQGGVRRDG